MTTSGLTDEERDKYGREAILRSGTSQPWEEIDPISRTVIGYMAEGAIVSYRADHAANPGARCAELVDAVQRWRLVHGRIASCQLWEIFEAEQAVMRAHDAILAAPDGDGGEV